jgi:hypothetical protein
MLGWGGKFYFDSIVFCKWNNYALLIIVKHLFILNNINYCILVADVDGNMLRTKLVKHAARKGLADALSKKTSRSKLAALDDQIDISIWDFGGQWSFYSTHSVFLGPRGIYVVVLDLSKSLDDDIELDCPVDVDGIQNLTGKSKYLFTA